MYLGENKEREERRNKQWKIDFKNSIQSYFIGSLQSNETSILFRFNRTDDTCFLQLIVIQNLRGAVLIN